MKVVYNRPTKAVLIADVMLVLLAIFWAPSAWWLFIGAAAYFTLMNFIGPKNYKIMEDDGNGNVLLYTDDLGLKEEGHYILFNDENLVSWNVSDDYGSSVIIQYRQNGEETIAFANTNNFTDCVKFLQKRFRLKNIDRIEQGRVLDFINSNRQEALEKRGIKQENIFVWTFKYIRDMFIPERRAERKRIAEAGKKYRRAQLEKSKKQEAERKKAMGVKVEEPEVMGPLPDGEFDEFSENPETIADKKKK